MFQGVLSTPELVIDEGPSQSKKRSRSRGPLKENTNKPAEVVKVVPPPQPPMLVPKPQETVVRRRVQFKTGPDLVQVKQYVCEGRLNKINKDKDYTKLPVKVIRIQRLKRLMFFNPLRHNSKKFN